MAIVRDAEPALHIDSTNPKLFQALCQPPFPVTQAYIQLRATGFSPEDPYYLNRRDIDADTTLVLSETPNGLEGIPFTHTEHRYTLRFGGKHEWFAYDYLPTNSVSSLVDSRLAPARMHFRASFQQFHKLVHKPIPFSSSMIRFLELLEEERYEVELAKIEILDAARKPNPEAQRNSAKDRMRLILGQDQEVDPKSYLVDLNGQPIRRVNGAYFVAQPAETPNYTITRNWFMRLPNRIFGGSVVPGSKVTQPTTTPQG